MTHDAPKPITCPARPPCGWPTCRCLSVDPLPVHPPERAPVEYLWWPLWRWLL